MKRQKRRMNITKNLKMQLVLNVACNGVVYQITTKGCYAQSGEYASAEVVCSIFVATYLSEHKLNIIHIILPFSFFSCPF